MSLALCGLGCGVQDGGNLSGDLPKVGSTLFTLLPATATGIAFENRLVETNERNVFTYRNYYNGGGTAIGDLNGDGLPEVVLTANEKGPRLYLNGGRFRFRDVTKESGLRTAPDQWTTGVAFADVNADGLLDIYICRAGLLPPERRANALWINQGAKDGIPTFREMAEDYGVADRGYSTHAAFFDYDRDGDLDLFVINNSPRPVSSFEIRNTRHERDPHGGSQLYRNDGKRFTNVTAAAGIHSPEMAFALGIGISDVNRDGWPDVYVANDFFERDYLYVNDRDGTFTDRIEQQMPVVTYFSMGLDIADVDNDGWTDIYTTDMLPEDQYRLKATTTFESWEVYWEKVRNGYHHQLIRNMLQRNNGDGTFSDVSQLVGVAATDWTWSALIADLDLDGRSDIFVTNGMAKDITAQDYLKFLGSDETMRATLTPAARGRAKVDFIKLTKAMPTTSLPDYAFRNLGGRFANVAGEWGLDKPSFSSGAAYGDLDGDGALDLVVNNVNDVAFVYRNNVRAIHPTHAFLKVRLVGEGANRFGLGARVTVFAGSSKRERESDAYMQEQSPSRGFQSSVDYDLVFGLGDRETLDSMRVEWPNGRITRLDTVRPNQLVTVHQSQSVAPQADSGVLRGSRTSPTFIDVTAATGIAFKHVENEFADFDRERLIPKLLSIEGPALAVGDVDGDKLDDVFIGGAKGQSGRVFRQRRDGRFVGLDSTVFTADAISEDVGAVFFDADRDGDQDLYVVGGGSEYSDGAPALQDRLYLNDGRGNFTKAVARLPTEALSGSRVVAADYDSDGDIDLFVGGRVVTWRYGLDPQSMLLRNDGSGRFTDATMQLAPELARAGMVTDALWQDIDGDSRVDLVVVGEWMPITIFRNVGGGRLVRLPDRGLEKSHGWWNRIVAADFTGDGRVDFIVGNLGLNSRLRASEAQPATLHVRDFDGNGFIEQILSMYNGEGRYPLPLRDELVGTIPSLAARFPTYKDYAQKTLEQVFTAEELSGAVTKLTYTFASSLARNNGDGSFTLTPLPVDAQITSTHAILAGDFNGDGRADAMLAGNFDGFKPDIGRMSAGEGLIIYGEGNGAFRPMRPRETGFRVPGQARDIRRLRAAQGFLYVVGRNNDVPLVFRER